MRHIALFQVEKWINAGCPGADRADLTVIGAIGQNIIRRAEWKAKRMFDTCEKKMAA
jgi:hypothetical protein